MQHSRDMQYISGWPASALTHTVLFGAPGSAFRPFREILALTGGRREGGSVVRRHESQLPIGLSGKSSDVRASTRNGLSA